MKAKMDTRDPDILGSWPALLRAARRAKRLAIETNTPLWIVKNGKIVNANPSYKPAGRRNGRANCKKATRAK